LKICLYEVFVNPGRSLGISVSLSLSPWIHSLMQDLLLANLPRV